MAVAKHLFAVLCCAAAWTVAGVGGARAGRQVSSALSAATMACYSASTLTVVAGQTKSCVGFESCPRGTICASKTQIQSLRLQALLDVQPGTRKMPSNKKRKKKKQVTSSSSSSSSSSSTSSSTSTNEPFDVRSSGASSGDEGFGVGEIGIIIAVTLIGLLIIVGVFLFAICYNRDDAQLLIHAHSEAS